MSTEAILEHCRTLSLDEKLRVLEELWDEIQSEGAVRPITDDERAFLEERIREAEADPRPDRSWEDVRHELLNAR